MRTSALWCNEIAVGRKFYTAIYYPITVGKLKLKMQNRCAHIVIEQHAPIFCLTLFQPFLTFVPCSFSVEISLVCNRAS